jgi:hypothetical protein
MMFLFFVMFVVARAEWPPQRCSEDVTFQGQDVIMTSESHDNVITSCEISESFQNVVYMEFTRRYTRKSRHRVQSSLTISAQNFFNVIISNDKIEIEYTNNTNEKELNSCLARSVSKKDETSWLRMRMHKMRDLNKTFISVGIAALNSKMFTTCSKFEIEGYILPVKLKLSGKTSTGMDQIIHKFTDKRPIFKSATDISIMARLDVLEKRLSRIETAYSRQTGALRQEQEKLHLKIDDSQERLTKKVSLAHQEVHEKVKSWSMINMVVIFIALVLFGFYLRWKIWKEKRYHLL